MWMGTGTGTGTSGDAPPTLALLAGAATPTWVRPRASGGVGGDGPGRGCEWGREQERPGTTTQWHTTWDGVWDGDGDENGGDGSGWVGRGHEAWVCLLVGDGGMDKPKR